MPLDAEGYTVNLRCDACPNEGMDTQETIYGENKRTCWRNVHREGWRVWGRSGEESEALCPMHARRHREGQPVQVGGRQPRACFNCGRRPELVTTTGPYEWLLYHYHPLCPYGVRIEKAMRQACIEEWERINAPR